MGWKPGESVLWRSRPGAEIGYLYSANVVVDGDAAIALFQPTGAPGKRRVGRRGGPGGRNMLPGGWERRHEDFTWSGPGTIRLHPQGCAYSVLRYWDGTTDHYQGWYVNLEQPWRRTPVGFDSRDDVLDILVGDDLSGARLKDEDELNWSVEVGKLSPKEATEIRLTARGVLSRIEGREWPFHDDAWTGLIPDPNWNMPQTPEGWAELFQA